MMLSTQLMLKSAITERDGTAKLLAIFTMATPKWAELEARDRVLAGLIVSD
jgi:hypothetical protein